MVEILGAALCQDLGTVCLGLVAGCIDYPTQAFIRRCVTSK